MLHPDGAKSFLLLLKWWMVERTHGWLHWCRRFNVDYKRLPTASEALIHLAMIHLMLRRLA
ncbi:MAG: transposase [Stenomitos rutilans HA7619-LM2]|nr:transposase [Stenomitos rutilans HA7619-LM2]